LVLRQISPSLNANSESSICSKSAGINKMHRKALAAPAIGYQVKNTKSIHPLASFESGNENCPTSKVFYDGFEGWLEKKHAGLMSWWQSRYFRLEPISRCLTYYKNNTEIFPLGYIPLAGTLIHLFQKKCCNLIVRTLKEKT
jgi:hypothetical protein